MRSIGCDGWFGGSGDPAFAGLGGLHLERVVETVEVVEQPDGAEQFNDFALGIKAAQLRKLFVGNSVGVTSHSFGQAEGGLFGGCKVLALLPRGQVFELIVGPAKAPA